MFFVVSLLFLGVVILWKSPKITASKDNSLNAEKLFSLVNKWRVKTGFQSYEKHEALCRIASKRNYDNHKGLLEQYSKYPSVISENMTMAPTEQNALYDWLHSKTHKKALEASYKYSCIATQGNFAVQIFSNCENSCP